MIGAQDFSALVRELLGELKQQRAADPSGKPLSDARWRARAHERALRRIKVPHEFLDWAMRDRHWSFTLAEVLRDSVAKPAELAARLLMAMLEQLEDELEMAEPEIAVTALGAGTHA
jgi:hypothetical protein